jgi:DNA-binding LacI/PurR family transcriptional regulator
MMPANGGPNGVNGAGIAAAHEMRSPDAQPRRRSTLRDVAERANVSVQTVSNLVNGRTHLMAEKTRERVEQAMIALDYRPNATARGLRIARVHTLGVFVLDEDARFLADPMTDLVMAGVGDVARDRGYGVLIQSARPGSIDDGLLAPLHEHRVDGAMLYLSGDASVRSACVSRVRELGYTFVVFQEMYDKGDVPSVSADNRDGARRLTEYLLDRGHTRVAFTAALTAWPMIEERHSGYVDAHRARGIEPPRELQLFRGRWDPQSGEEMANALLSLAEPPTAIMGGNDLLALGVMRAVRAAGLKIPDDIAVTGFNDFNFSAFVDPPLTTVAIPAYEMGAASATILIDRVEGKETESRRTFPVELVLRESA